MIVDTLRVQANGTRIVNYNRNMFILQATEVVDTFVSGAMTFCQMINQTMHVQLILHPFIFTKKNTIS
jgi:hypothetical protein